MQLGLVGSSFLSEKKLHLCVAHIMMPFFNTCLIMKEPVLFFFFFSKMVQQVTPQTAQCICDRIISRVFLASSFARADMFTI